MLDLEKQKGNYNQRERFLVTEPRKSSSASSHSVAYSEQFKTEARNGFIKKVYSILSVQLIITVLFCFLANSNTGFQKFQLGNMWLAWTSMIASIVVMFALVCIPSLGKKVPLNYVLLGIFTFAEAYSVSFFCIFFSGKTVLSAAVITGGVVIALTFYAMTTKSDFTLSGGILYIVGSVLFMLVIVNFFIGSSFMSMLISAGFALLFGVYLVYDTQLIVGGKNAELELDDYILGALMLYSDIIGLFINILQLLGNNND